MPIFPVDNIRIRSVLFVLNVKCCALVVPIKLVLAVVPPLPKVDHASPPFAAHKLRQTPALRKTKHAESVL